MLVVIRIKIDAKCKMPRRPFGRRGIFYELASVGSVSIHLLSEKGSDHSVELLLRAPVLGEIQPPPTGEVDR